MYQKNTLYIKRSEYNNLTTRQKLDRVTRLVRILNDFNSGKLSDMGEKRALTTLVRYLFLEDTNYMTEEEKELFEYFKLIEKK